MGVAAVAASGPQAARESRQPAARPRISLPADRLALSTPTPKKRPSDTRRTWWDILVFSTPILDQLHQAWGLAAQANNAAVNIAMVPHVAKGLGGGAAATALGRIGVLGIIERVIGSGAFQTAARFLSRPAVQTVGRIAGRIAPFIAAGFAFFDIRNAYRTGQDPNASDLRKTLKWIKAGASTVAAGAGMATLVLAPTGVGAAIAGAVALGAGLVAMGLDFLTSKIAPT